MDQQEIPGTSEHGLSSPQDFWSRFVQPRIAHIQNVSPLNSTNLVRDARQTIDDELDGLHLAMCRLRKRRNALSLISCLPPEVFAYIFKILTDAMPPQKSSSDRLTRLGWINVTHVCTHWRDMALLNPSLWGNIDDGITPRWREAMIARGKSAPLSICLPYYHSVDNALFTQHAYHTRELCLSALWQNSLVFQLLTSPTPILEHLDLQASDSTAVIPPADIFARHTPSLRHVTLCGVFFPWSAPIFCNLTYLRVDLSRVSGPPSVLLHESDTASQHDHLFNALTRMPTLRTLDLERCFPPRSQSLHPVGHILVVLPHLELLSLTGVLVECVGFAQHLKIPSSSRFVLKCPGAPQQMDPGLAHFLQGYLSGGAAPRLLTLSIEDQKEYANGPNLVSIKLWCTCSPSDLLLQDFCHKSKPFISILVPPSPDSSPDSSEDLCHALPLEDLRVLKVTYDHDNWSPEAWINIFGRCRLVEHVHVGGQLIVANFCRSLVRPLSGAAGTATAAKDLLFRHLKSLEMENGNFLEYASVEGEGVHPQFGYLLNGWLSTRADLITNELHCADGDKYESKRDQKDGGQAGRTLEDSRLERLVITRCSIARKCVEEIRGQVQHLVWDGYEGLVVYQPFEGEFEEGIVYSFYID